MSGVEVSDSITNDLIVEIFSRLPSNSVARFRCVSKLWGYMLSRPYFRELFLTRSWARPRLLFAIVRDGEWSFFTSPQLQNPYDGKVSVCFHMKLSKDMFPEYFRGLESGLIYFCGMYISRKKDEDAVPVIFNPTTRQYVSFPQLKRDIYTRSYLGFDPIDKQFKVLSMGRPYCEERCNDPGPAHLNKFKWIDLATYVIKVHLPFPVTYPKRTPELSVLMLE